MRRLLLVVPVVLAALLVGFGAAWMGADAPSQAATVDVYPRPLAPLPVPEVRLPGDPLPDPQASGVVPTPEPMKVPDDLRLCGAPATKGPVPQAPPLCRIE